LKTAAPAKRITGGDRFVSMSDGRRGEVEKWLPLSAGDEAGYINLSQNLDNDKVN